MYSNKKNLFQLSFNHGTDLKNYTYFGIMPRLFLCSQIYHICCFTEEKNLTYHLCKYRSEALVERDNDSRLLSWKCYFCHFQALQSPKVRLQNQLHYLSIFFYYVHLPSYVYKHLLLLAYSSLALLSKISCDLQLLIYVSFHSKLYFVFHIHLEILR